MTPTVVFDHVWKKFRRGERHDSLRDFIPSLIKSISTRRSRERLEDRQEFWALQDVSFELPAGEALGIIGPNGAGKSTTLKLLTRILRPNKGHCLVRGRVGALIEVAAGFHPDLTGRENVFLQGAIMGMRRHEIITRLDDIVDFAGVHDFIDTPVKRYSSGMNARLGFAIAAHLDPQVLIVDEVLSVGDVAFQRRCIDRMRSFKRSGVTIVFVSHNLQAVNDLCDSTLYVKGSTQALGPTPEVLSKYVAATTSNVASDTDQASILSAEFSGGGKSVVAEPGARLTLRVTYRANRRLTDFHLGFLIHRSTDLLVVYDGNVTDHELGLLSVEAGTEFTVDFHFTAHLVRGQYHVECHVYENATQAFLAKLSPAGLIRMEESRTFAGVADIALEPSLIRAPQDALPAAVASRN